MKRFTVDGSDALENYLGRICQEVLRSIQALFRPSRLEALVLGGGYGRGEGGVLHTEAGDRPYNDLEFYVFLRGNRLWNDFRYRADLSDLGERLSVAAGLHVEFKIDSLRRLEQSQVSMFSYDLVSGHRRLFGSQTLFQNCAHHLAAAHLPLAEATRLLFNRCSGLLLVRRLLRKATARHSGRRGWCGKPPGETMLTKAQADFVGRNLAKAQLALGDALLAAFGEYHWSCPQRHRRLQSLSAVDSLPGLERVLQHHAAGVEFKLHPRRIFKSAEAFGREHAELCALAARLWLWLESRRLEHPFASPQEYGLSTVEKYPGTSVWRNCLLNARAFGPASLLGALAARYPRERLLNALALLLWTGDGSEVPGLIQHLQRQLQTKASDWAGLVRAYERAWLRYG
ncbi:conserved hypothetical protein [Verrucomicrobia bacterium]|nr:conserved hypothetical protein [Verrucomicrobiota bacterium]